MYSQITRRLLSYCVVKSKYGRSSRSCTTGISYPVSSIARRLSTSSLQRFEKEETKFEYKHDECGDAPIDHESDCSASGSYEEPDEFEEDYVVDEGTIDYEAITNNAPEKTAALQLVLDEIQLLRERGSPFIPTKISPYRWSMLLDCRTSKERRCLLKHIFLMEKKQKVEKQRKAERLKNYCQMPKPPREKRKTNSPLNYRLSNNTLFYRQRKTNIMAYYNYRLAMAEWFGSSLIIDCGYESYMNTREIHHCCTQLTQCWVENRIVQNPFNIIFSNAEENNSVFKYFERLMPTISTIYNPVNFTKRHYTDLFPPEKMIYLSPHSENVMEEYEPDSVYIIGAFVDEAVHDPISMQRAERDGIRTAKFPLDKYLNWCQGSQLLPMNQCVSILNRLKSGIPWEDALRCVAGRKLNYVGLNFDKDPKVDLKSTRHMWAIYSYEMGKEPSRRAPTEL